MAAGSPQTPRSAAALERLCRNYWYPLYAFVRGRGYGEHDAKDLTQAFFTRLLERKGLEGVIPGEGKFRSFLLTALKRFVADEYDRQQAQKRGGGAVHLPIDAQDAEERYLVEPMDPNTPERQFERRWALAVLDAASARLQVEFETAGKGALFAALMASCLKDGPGTYAQAATAVGLSEEAFKKAMQRMRRRYQELIRDEVALTVPAGEVQEELRQLWAVFGR